MRNLNINQFALPGMEGMAHPGARHLAKGITFTPEHAQGHYPPEVRREGGYNTTVTPQAHVHRLYAHKMGAQFDPERHHGNALGFIEWAGQHDQGSRQDEPGQMYPGEIKMVERSYDPAADRSKGLMTDLYRMGHEMSFGQSTVPLHSPERTPQGESWSKKVGGPRPRVGDTDWTPPKGIHPYEKAAAQAGRREGIERAKTKKKRPGQGTLF